LFFSLYAIDVLFLGKGEKSVMLFQEPAHTTLDAKVSKIRIPDFNYFISTRQQVAESDQNSRLSYHKIVHDDQGSAMISFPCSDQSGIDLFLSNLYAYLNRYSVSMSVIDYPSHKGHLQLLQTQQQAVVIYLTSNYDYFLYSYIDHKPRVEFVWSTMRQVVWEGYVQNKVFFSIFSLFTTRSTTYSNNSEK